ARSAVHDIYYAPTALCLHDWPGALAARSLPKAVEAEAVVAAREGHRRFMVEKNRLQAVYKNYERTRLRRIWRGLQAYDRGRRRALAEHVARGCGPLPERVLQAVEQAHSYCRTHRIGMWLRRWRTQRLRRVADEAFTALIVEGLHEPSGVGDLYAIVDRYCASGRAEIHMETADSGCLGPGWHQVEKSNNGHPALRWSMAECWFYLRGTSPWSAVLMSLVPQPRDT